MGHKLSTTMGELLSQVHWIKPGQIYTKQGKPTLNRPTQSHIVYHTILHPGPRDSLLLWFVHHARWQNKVKRYSSWLALVSSLGHLKHEKSEG